MKALLNKNLFLLLMPFLFSACQRTISWDLDATGTLKDAQGICFPANISGTFYNGITPGSDTAYVEVKVNVFSTGNYTISTDIQNGLRFIDSGFFNTTGIHVIKLKPVGTPVNIMPVNFAVHFDTSFCSFTLDVKDSTLLTDKTLNTWQYTDTKKKITYHGTINATYFLVTPLSGLLSLRHETNIAGDTTFEIGIVYPTENITTGMFTTDSLNNVALSTRGRCINCAWDVMYALTGAITTIVVESYDPQTGIIKGAFSGTTVNWNNEVAPIDKGKFSAVVKK